MKNVFLLTALAAVLLVGCNEPEEVSAPVNSPSMEVPQKTTVEESGMDKLMKLTECAAVSNIAEQVYTLASQGVSVDSISSTVFSDLTEADGPIYGLLKSTIQMTSEEVTAMLDDPNAIDLEVSQLSRLWSAEVFKLCNADQL